MQPTHAVSFWQPWAAALLAPPWGNGKRRKPYEFRSWELPPRYVGVTLGLHAAQQRERDWEGIAREFGLDPEYCWQRGMLIGTIVFAKPIPFPGVGGPTDDRPSLPGDIWRCPGAPRACAERTWWAWPVVETARLELPRAMAGRQRVWRIEREAEGAQADQRTLFGG